MHNNGCAILGAGHDIEPVAEHTGGAHTDAPKDKEWGAMIAACFVVLSCTLIGLLTLVPCISAPRKNESQEKLWLSATSAFASGALIAAAAFLMLPESTPLAHSLTHAQSTPRPCQVTVHATMLTFHGRAKFS